MQSKVSDREKWSIAFEYCMQQLAGVYGREFGHPTMKAYMDACEGWSVEKMREVFRKAMDAERFCPTIATLKAYGGSVREEMAPIVPAYKPPRYSDAERADIEAMKADLRRQGLSMPWAKDAPGVFWS